MSKRSTPSFKSRKQSRGFSLIEFGIVVALIAGATVIVYLMFSGRNDSATASAEAQNFTMMAADAQQKWRAQGNFTGINAEALINNGVVPSTMVVGSTIETRWNTPVTVAAGTITSAGDSAVFTYQVPRRSCADFVTQAGSSAVVVAVDGTDVKNVPAGENTMNVTTVGSSCDSTSGGGNVPVMLTITR